MTFVESSEKAWAKIRNPDSGYTWSVPVIDWTVRYALDRIPQLTLAIPYGKTLGNYNVPGTAIPSNEQDYQILLLVRNTAHSGFYEKLFSGYITHTRTARMQGGKQITRMAARSYLGYLQGQKNYALETGRADGWYGLSAFKDASGFPYTAAESDLAAGITGITDIIKNTLVEICNNQIYSPWGFPGSQDAAANAKRAIQDGLSIDYSLIKDGDQHTYHNNDDDPVVVGPFLPGTRTEIANGITDTLGRLGNNLWDGLRAFCKSPGMQFQGGVFRGFGFRIIPTAKGIYGVDDIGDWHVAPMLTIQHVPSWRRDKIYKTEYTEISTERKTATVQPVRSTLMIAEETGHDAYNLGAEFTQRIVGSAYLTEFDEGVLERIPWPGWIPTWNLDGQDMAFSFCAENILKKRFGQIQATIVFPMLKNIAPGTTVEVENIGDQVPTFGAYDAAGLVQAVELHGSSEEPSVRTTIVISPLMEVDTNSDTYDELALRNHPVTFDQYFNSTDLWD